jgi:hypothetical protein
MRDQGYGRDASPNWVRSQFLADTPESKLKGNTGTVKSRCILLIKFLAVPDRNILVLNIELTKIKITLVINLKWYNLSYPCYPVGRPHVTFPVTIKRNIP